MCLRVSAFFLRRGCIRSESHWTVLYLIALYSHILDGRKIEMQNVAQRNGDDLASKRPRFAFSYQDIIRQAVVGQAPARISALQILSFLSHVGPFTDTQLEEMLLTFSNCFADPIPSVVNWAMIACAW